MLIIEKDQIRSSVSPAIAVAAVEAAFAGLGRGLARLPGVISLELPEVEGEVHVKGAYIEGDPVFVFKVATGFYQNPQRGLPSGSGLMLAFDATTGQPAAILLDGGWLTDIRTGAAGAVAARHLANPELGTVVVVGAGVQARHQLRCLAEVREFARAMVWNRSPDRAVSCAEQMGRELGVEVTVAHDLEAAVRQADLLITVTPSREPLISADWLAPGVHVNAVGSDGPDKRELETEVLRRADVLVADRLEQCRTLGEIHHGLADDSIALQDVDAELGQIVAGDHPGRTAEEQITVCDLTGVGVQDAAIAAAALRSVQAAGL